MKRSVLFFAAVAVLSCTVPTSPVTATTWHVPGDASTIKGGIGLSSAGDTVLVACGTYNESNIRMRSGIVLRSETGQPDCVTIDAQQQDRVILCRSVAGTTVIEGFTLTGGLAPDDGGGLYCQDNSLPSIINCTITNNEAPINGGGVASDHSSPSFISCSITANSAVNGGSGMYFYGGGLGGPSAPTLTGCSVSDNLGTGIWSVASILELTSCDITGNSSSGISCNGVHFPGGSVALTDCTISGNSASNGGGLKVWECPATLANCTLSGNSASAHGGGLYAIASTVTLTHCSLTGNSASSDGGGIYLLTQNGASNVTADSTEFSNNTADRSGAHGFVQTGSAALLTCSVPDDTGFDGGGTITVDNSGCQTPVRRQSWGSIKALYR